VGGGGLLKSTQRRQLWRKVIHDRKCGSENKKSLLFLLNSTQIKNP